MTDVRTDLIRVKVDAIISTFPWVLVVELRLEEDPAQADRTQQGRFLAAQRDR